MASIWKLVINLDLHDIICPNKVNKCSKDTLVSFIYILYFFKFYVCFPYSYERGPIKWSSQNHFTHISIFHAEITWPKPSSVDYSKFSYKLIVVLIILYFKASCETSIVNQTDIQSEYFLLLINILIMYLKSVCIYLCWLKPLCTGKICQ